MWGICEPLKYLCRILLSNFILYERYFTLYETIKQNLTRKRELFMYEYDLLLSQPEEIDFNPHDLTREILQNVRTILTTYKYSVPLDRDLGLNATFLDEAQPRAVALLSSEMADALTKFEPRAKLREVRIEQDSNGKFWPRVKIRLNTV